MASSDDEDESLPLSVANYHFVDDKDDPVSFSVLPIQWRETEEIGGDNPQVFLHGTADNGLQKLYKQVIAWKFDLSNVKPEISVLTKENSWIILQKPRKSFEDVIGSILITVNCLHFINRNPDTLGKSLWDHLSKVFRCLLHLYEVRPSKNDLVDHSTLIIEAMKRNDTLAKSKFLLAFLDEKPRKRKLPDEERQATTISSFIVDETDENIVDYAEEDDSKEDDELFDSVCTFCDNGGDILCCEGSCLRSFHATVESGEESLCDSLGYTKEAVNSIQQYLCKNCEYKEHQCFVCGKLGSSDKYSGAEVFRCVSATCGRFYHPHCVAKLLNPDNGVSAENLEKKIFDGESFTCPIHKCCVCKQGENNKDPDLQFAVCRRCPRSYHRKCLPRKISFEDIEEEGIITRAWIDLLPNRILIYCLKHKIDENIGTPVRNHVKFPGVEERKSTIEKRNTGIGEKRQKQTSEMLADRKKTKTRVLPLEKSHEGRTTHAESKQSKKSFSALKVGGKNTGKLSVGSSISKNVKVNDASRKEMNSRMTEENNSLGGELDTPYNERSKSVKLRKRDVKLNKAAIVNPTSKKELPPLDADREKRILELMKDAESKINIEGIKQKYKVPSTHVTTKNLAAEKAAITLGKVEVSVEAIRAALRKLEEGSSIEDAKAVCSSEVLERMFKWRDRLGVSLSPFLHGMRYTSFGRHFTKVEKLEEIINKLHWYVQDGDMIVDFCCGANDFSVLMRKKLDETGKKCSYKNYDFIQPKNDFCFEKRDWMSVKPKELPTGSKLIMGLNPPFGVRACLANKFIDKALEFQPKLLILIVPSETERLDEKKSPYDLVWEDDHLLSGKSFYLPGSANVKDKQMEQWNVKPPLLYLWSRPDWSDTHRKITESHPNIFKQEEVVADVHHKVVIHDHSMGDHDDLGEFHDRAMADCGDYDNNPKHALGDPGDFSYIPDHAIDGHQNFMPTNDPLETENLKGDVTGVVGTGGRKEYSPSISSDRGNHESPTRKKASNEKSKRQSRNRRNKKKRASGQADTKSKQGSGSRSLVTEMPNRVSPYTDSNQHFDSSVPRMHSQFGTANVEELDRRYANVGDAHHSNFPTRSATDYGVSFSSRPLDTDNMHRREYTVRSQLQHYGQQDPEVQGGYYPGGPDSRYGQIGTHTPYPSTYGNLGPISESSYRSNSSGAQWYIPQSDPLLHSRMHTLGSEPPLPMFAGNNIFDPRAVPSYGHPDLRLSFASGPPHQPYSHNSAGR
ncbi:protein ENHANCED DOWNY MILDEW 2 isoform X2 [Humulus lupulus]|uniref:protein ENHANCED DOWNY MILDEW 2 isoform X2 n=1 Tax=Humulus lupulus TaxID=3486 RepID=UPI002B40CB95|nr:protein ENHANCED DOWNY MILDEW 2 isoform X2 [Humulus lupulus]